jgi:NTP pyrophosphatase (non-canonical NTP hydrolase)
MKEKEFSTLRAANVARQSAWHPDRQPDLSYRGNELAGETGEVCNAIKKLERARFGWNGSRDTIEHLAEELADVVICSDLVAIATGIDLESAVANKFNATSIELGFPHRIAPATDRLETLTKALEEARDFAAWVKAHYFHEANDRALVLLARIEALIKQEEQQSAPQPQ